MVHIWAYIKDFQLASGCVSAISCVLETANTSPVQVERS